MSYCLYGNESVCTSWLLFSMLGCAVSPVRFRFLALRDEQSDMRFLFSARIWGGEDKAATSR